MKIPTADIRIVIVKIEFSEHFWKCFEERRKAAPVKITRDTVIQAIENPDLIIPDPYNPSREWRIKKIEGYCFKVIVEHVQDGILVLTLFFDKKDYASGIRLKSRHSLHKAQRNFTC